MFRSHSVYLQLILAIYIVVFCHLVTMVWGSIKAENVPVTRRDTGFGPAEATPTSTAFNSPFSILVLAEPNPITYMSGQSQRFRILLQHLAERYSSDKVELVTCDKAHPNPPETCFNGKIPIHYTGGFRLPQYNSLTVSLDLGAKIWRLTGKRRYDMIHVSSPGLLPIPTILAARLRGIPLVMSYHTHLPVYVHTYLRPPWNRIAEWLLWRLLKAAHCLADLNLVTSPQMSQELEQHGIPNFVWPKGVNTTQFHPQHKSAAMRDRMSQGHSQDLLLVYIGRIAREKRLTMLKPILAKLNAKGISTRLCIVGHGPELEELRAFFQDSPTCFLGSLEGLELSQAVASGDIFVMPSDSETLGFVVMESMASGVPVVAARAGGLIDLIVDGEDGFLVDPNDEDAFLECVAKLYQDSSFRRGMSKRGRLSAKDWSWETSMDYLRLQAYPEAKRRFSRRRPFGKWWRSGTQVKD